MDIAEIPGAVDLCTPEGRLNPAAVGRSIQPRHRCNLVGHPLRKKRWDYWCVVSQDCVLAITAADVDYLTTVDLWLYDRATGRSVSRRSATPMGGRIGFAAEAWRPACHAPLATSFRSEPEADGLHLRASSAQADLVIDVHVAIPASTESINVVVPWSENRFHFTSKQLGLLAVGEVRCQGRRYEIGSGAPAFATLDFGRGVWPFRTRWNWASAAGIHDGAVLGFNLGARWTDGTGVTENGLHVAGRTEWCDDVGWTYDPRNMKAPWRLHSADQVDLTFTPQIERSSFIELGLLGARSHTWFGSFDGTLGTHAGPRRIAGLWGWAEDVSLRW